jgi:predicted nucleic acid-binding protein
VSLPSQLRQVNKIFLDTAPIIYFVEKNPNFFSKVEPIFINFDNGNLFGVVSPVTLAECLVLPQRFQKPDLIQLFLDLLVNSSNIDFLEIDEKTSITAANIRANNNISLTDAFQVAIAMQSGCDAFLTNDIGLKRIPDMPVIIVSEL